MTKKKLKYEVNIAIDRGDAKVQTIADIVANHYEEALLQVHPWHDGPTTHIIVTSDETTLKKMVEQLENTVGRDVTYREAPHYLYE